MLLVFGAVTYEVNFEGSSKFSFSSRYYITDLTTIFEYNKVKYVINSIGICSYLISDNGSYYFFLFNIVEWLDILNIVKLRFLRKI